MTGLELLRTSDTTADEIAGIISEHCPPVTPGNCDQLSCRACWLAWLTAGAAKRKGAVRQADDPERGRAAPQPRRVPANGEADPARNQADPQSACST